MAKALKDKYLEEEEWEAHKESRRQEAQEEYDGFVDWAPTKAMGRMEEYEEYYPDFYEAADVSNVTEAPGIHSRYGVTEEHPPTRVRDTTPKYEHSVPCN